MEKAVIEISFPQSFECTSNTNNRKKWNNVSTVRNRRKLLLPTYTNSTSMNQMVTSFPVCHAPGGKNVVPPFSAKAIITSTR
jgi:hypothetical protein